MRICVLRAIAAIADFDPSSQDSIESDIGLHSDESTRQQLPGSRDTIEDGSLYLFDDMDIDDDLMEDEGAQDLFNGSASRGRSSASGRSSNHRQMTPQRIYAGTRVR